MKSRLQSVVFAVALAALQGCGGGGGGAAPPPAPAFAVGGAATGLSGTGLIVTLNGGSDLTVAANGTFSFPALLASGTGYAVAVKTQPATPYQTCVITNGSGTVASAAVTNVSIACTTNNYAVSGTVSGLAATGLVLRLNGTVDLPVGANGSFMFPGELASGSNYAVAITSQPTSPFQTCVATNGSGVIGASDTSIAVNCTTDMFSVGGTVAGLAGTGLVLQLNGGQDLPVAGDGSFVFPTPLLRGSPYAVTIRSQTATYRELCSLSSATGTGASLDVTDVKVDCAIVLGFLYAANDVYQLIGYGIHAVTGVLLPMGTVGYVGFFTKDFAVAPDGGTLYAVDQSSSRVYGFSVDPSKGSLEALGASDRTGPAGAAASGLAIAPAGEFLYVSYSESTVIDMFLVDPATGALTPQGAVATGPVSGIHSRQQIAITPDGAFLYLLSQSTDLPSHVTTYAIDPSNGALAERTTITAGDARAMTLDPLGRFLYLREEITPPSEPTPESVLSPYTIDPNTGALTAVNVDTSVPAGEVQMIVEPSGRFAYLTTVTYLPLTYRVEAFSIDQVSGALAAIGTRMPFAGRGASKLVTDSSGRFLFMGNRKDSGTFDPGAPYDGSTFAIGQDGPTAGQLMAPGPGGGVGAGTEAIAVVQ